uniref:Uncharacterized protein n=2 Tax=Oryza punctata TaxID=4537 RepID=A0A0E0LU44_ORYPU
MLQSKLLTTKLTVECSSNTVWGGGRSSEVAAWLPDLAGPSFLGDQPLFPGGPAPSSRAALCGGRRRGGRRGEVAVRRPARLGGGVKARRGGGVDGGDGRHGQGGGQWQCRCHLFLFF